jgi:hypothetical protein
VIEGVLDSPKMLSPLVLIIAGEDSQHLTNGTVGAFQLSVCVLVK